MRATTLASLAALGLLLSGLGADAIAGSPTPKSSADDKKTVVWKTEVSGVDFGVSQARQMALAKAEEQLRSFLAARDPSFVLIPTAEYIGEHFVKGSKAGKSRQTPEGELNEQILTVEMTRQEYRQILNQDRMVRSDNRMVFLGKVMAGLVALFGAFAGYFRLEEATKGFYTAWLRAGAVGLVAIVGAGLYWFR